MHNTRKPTPGCRLALAAVMMATALNAGAATTVLAPQIVSRPVTPGDKAVYGLASSLEVSGGLNTVGVGTPIYLEAEVSSTIAASSITNVTWTLTSTPPGSAASLTTSPLGTNVPVYEPSDRSVYQVASRTLLRPDVRGQYTVAASIGISSGGTTNLTKTFTAGTYMGVNTCKLCHSGSSEAPDMWDFWKLTGHSMIFSNGINGYLGHYSQSCLACHTAGYDVNTNAVNGGFDDIMAQTGWTFPAVQGATNWDAMPASLRNVANIQCENCHGPGSEHAYSLGDTSKITATRASGDCNQCHDAPTHHIKGTEWYVSGHANTTRSPSGPTRLACVGCHTSDGFIARIEGASSTNTTYSAIGCQTCHEPHGQTIPAGNEHLLRVLGSVTLPDGTTVTNAGAGALCIQCHHVRNGGAETQLANYPIGRPTWLGGSSFGVHDGPQGDMLEGANAFTYGKAIPSSAHRFAVQDACVGCHMQTVGIGDPAFLKAGGHTFGMTYTTVSGGVTTTVDKVDACVQCHGPIDSFDMVRDDYNGDGVIEGVQVEVQHLLDKLSPLLPSSAYVASGNYIADGLVKSSVSFKTNWPAKFLKAGYNWQFVKNDGSFGVHNAPFAVGLLKASIADLTGDSNNDGLADSWQIQYFGSATSPSAAPNATPAGDGVPNWLKYALGLNPTVPGIAIQDVPGGIVWANGSTLGNSSATNTVQIYTAAEVAFNTEAGKTYQLQAISSLDGGWHNVGAPITGDGKAFSYVTPTRQNVQQYYRVQTLQ
ncbi:MAG TPA: hypothetical protein VJA21_14970 [Verrucomicrobiae bacterium]